jgi:ABC-2 type transport system permease protein
MKSLCRVLLVARKSLLEILREVQLLVLTVLMPLVFLVITVVTYTGELQGTYKIGVLAETPQGEAIIKILEQETYPDGQSVFQISRISEASALDTLLNEGDETVILTITGNPGNTTATIYGDALSTRFYKASTILENSLLDYGRETAGQPDVIVITEQPLAPRGPKTEFDLYAPGMITFGLLMIIPQTAMLVAREDRWKTLERLRLTRLHAWEILGGISLAQMVVAVFQVVIVLAAAIALGFNNQGSLGLAILIGLAVSASAIGQGLFVACFVQDDSKAANVASTFAMVQVFLSGSFYALPPLTMFSIAGHQIDLFDIFPASHGFRALQQVLTYGDGFHEIAFRLGSTLVLSLVYFVLGVVIFKRVKLKG